MCDGHHAAARSQIKWEIILPETDFCLVLIPWRKLLLLWRDRNYPVISFKSSFLKCDSDIKYLCFISLRGGFYPINLLKCATFYRIKPDERVIIRMHAFISFCSVCTTIRLKAGAVQTVLYFCEIIYFSLLWDYFVSFTVDIININKFSIDSCIFTNTLHTFIY